MKKCPYCAEEIQDAAIVCKHCGRDLAGAASGHVSGQKKGGIGARAFAVLVSLAFIGWCAERMSPGPTTTSPAASVPAPAAEPKPLSTPKPDDLALLSSRGYESSSGSYWYVEGQVKNLSDQPLRNVAAVATWYAKDGTFITADDALLEYNPLLPGQTSPFKTITRGNPLMSEYTVAFKHLLGGTIPTRDDRKSKK